ncbi:MAG: hypothetical protein U0793_30825 [Gemmataceae bacterium]
MNKSKAMDKESVQVVVRATLALMERIAKRTRTPADDLMTAILRSNQDRLVAATLSLLSGPDQPPTDEQVVKALESVGITL